MVSKVENKSSWKVGRNTTPDGNAIFKTNMNNEEEVDTVDTGFGSRKPTPEERLLKKYNKLNSMD